MKKHTRLKNNYFVLVGFILLFYACTEENPLKTYYYYFSQSNRKWIELNSESNNFIMKDSNGINNNFIFLYTDNMFNKGSTSYLGVVTEVTYREYIYKEFTSNYNSSLSISLAANRNPFGDEFEFQLNNLSFSYNFKFNKVIYVKLDDNKKRDNMTDINFESGEAGKIYSTVKIFDSLIVNMKTYYNVIHFSLNDFKDEWENFTITDIYYAKEYGLIKYIYHNGIYYERN